MFDIDSGKLLIVAVLALIVIGPKELPRVLRQVGQSVGKLRRMASEFQGQFMDAMKEADVADIRKELDELNKSAALDVHFDPARDIQAELTSVMKPAAVTSDSVAPSPAAGFELPASASAAELGPAAAGVAPLAEPGLSEDSPTVPALPDESLLETTSLNGSADMLLPSQAKRRILVKRHRSRLNVLQPEAVANRTGEPIRVRRRVVRSKASAAENMPTL